MSNQQQDLSLGIMKPREEEVRLSEIAIESKLRIENILMKLRMLREKFSTLRKPSINIED